MFPFLGLATFHQFSPGVYTVAGGDEWGTLLVLNFTVSDHVVQGYKCDNRDHNQFFRNYCSFHRKSCPRVSATFPAIGQHVPSENSGWDMSWFQRIGIGAYKCLS